MSSQAEISKLSSELNSRISREMDEMMNNVSSQIQRAINDAISNQVLPQIQNVIMAESGHVTRKGWNVPAERPEPNPEVQRNLNAKNKSRNEQDNGHRNGDLPSYNVHDTSTLGGRSRGNITALEHRSGELHMCPETKDTRKPRESCPKKAFKLSNQGHAIKEGSVDSHNSDQNYDTRRNVSCNHATIGKMS